MSKWSKVGNFAWNTVWLVGRGGIATPALAGLDTLQTVGNVLSNVGEVVRDTKQKFGKPFLVLMLKVK